MDAISAVGGAMSPMQMKGKPPSAEDIAQKIMDQADQDNSGGLSLDEVKFDSQAFAKMDSNSDGIIGIEELQSGISEKMQELGPPKMGGGHRSPEEMASKIMEHADLDSSGGLSASELGASSEVFDELDTNEDGVVDMEELAAAMKGPEQQGSPDVAKAGQGQGPMGMGAMGMGGIGNFMGTNSTNTDESSLLSSLLKEKEDDESELNLSTDSQTSSINTDSTNAYEVNEPVDILA